MYIKIILNVITVMLLSILQISFIGGLPDILNGINLIIIVLVFVLSFSNLRFALYWAIGFGFVMDVYSFFSFGTYLFLFPIVVLSANFLFVNFFTNRSLYSLVALSIFSSLLFKLLLFLAGFFSFSFGLKEYYLSIDPRKELKLIVVEVALATTLFYVFNYINKNSRSAFLLKYKT